MRRVVRAAMVAAIALCAACGKDKAGDTAADAGAATTTADAAVATAEAGAVADASVTAMGEEKPLPTEHHAEAKATREISATNYKSEIDKLAKEIGAQ